MGKGTYATRVSDALGLRHIAAGDLVREEMRKGSDLGNQVRGVAVKWRCSLPHAAPSCKR